MTLWPIGPEAKAELARLRAERDELAKALRNMVIVSFGLRDHPVVEQARAALRKAGFEEEEA